MHPGLLIPFIIIGLVFGLFGSGGAILIIPLFMIFFNISMEIAIRYSFVLVGFLAFLATILRRKTLRIYDSIIIVTSSLLGVFISRSLIKPYIPSVIWGIASERIFIGLLLVMIAGSSYHMLHTTEHSQKPHQFSSTQTNMFTISLGYILGSMMGLLGAGGGFLVVPFLMRFLGFHINEALSSSALIIMLNSWMGIYTDFYVLTRAEWIALGYLALPTFLGFLVGVLLSSQLKTNFLRKGLGYFLALVAIFLFTKEFFIFSFFPI